MASRQNPSTHSEVGRGRASCLREGQQLAAPLFFRLAQTPPPQYLHLLRLPPIRVRVLKPGV